MRKEEIFRARGWVVGVIMGKADELSEKIKKMSLQDLLKLAAMTIESKQSESHIEFVLVHLEMALQKRKLIKQFGMIK